MSLGVAAFPPAPASAARVQVSGDRLLVRAAPGEQNALVVSFGRSRITVTDTAPPQAGSGCAGQVSVAGPVTCAPAGVARLVITAGDGDDTVDLRRASIPSRISGGDGNDRLAGGAAGDGLLGGPGSDTLLGRGGADRLSGGAGEDLLRGSQDTDLVLGGSGDDALDGGAGPDTLAGQSGFDSSSYAGRPGPVVVRLDGLAGDGELGEGDNVLGGLESITGTAAGDQIVAPQAGQRGASSGITAQGGGGSDVLVGGPGPDDLVGEAGSDRLLGGDGADLIVGGTGDDRLDGGGSRDVVEARGGGVDRLQCGPGYDSVNVDRTDVVHPGCEVFGGPDESSFDPTGRGMKPGRGAKFQAQFVPLRRGRGVRVRVVTADHKSRFTLPVKVTFLNRRRHAIGRSRRLRITVNTWTVVPGARAPARARYVRLRPLL